MSLLSDKILARMYLYHLNNNPDKGFTHDQLFTLLQRPAGDKKVVIDDLTDATFQAALQELMVRHYLAKSDSHGTTYLSLTDAGKRKGWRWLNSNLGAQPAANEVVHRTPASQESEGIGCAALIAVLILAIAGFVIYVLGDPALKSNLFCSNSEYQKKTRVVTQRVESMRKEAGSSSALALELPKNSELEIVDGPRSSDGVCWWKVKTYVAGSNGAWSSEGWLPEKNKAGEAIFKKRQ